MRLFPITKLFSNVIMLLLLIQVVAPAAEDHGPADTAADILSLTGNETRVVWLRHKQWETYKGGVDGGADHCIMVFDTTSKAEREIVSGNRHYNPLISPSGRQVIYSAGVAGENKTQIKAIDWDGTNERILADGFALWVWRDPATAVEWVYASNAGGNDGKWIDRFRLDQPETRERFYSGQVANRFSLSADGTRGFGEFPWPNAGMLYTRTGQIDRKDYRTGCNSYIAPDNSYRAMIMAGSHDLVTLYNPDGSRLDVRVVPPKLKPLLHGGRGCMWNPKWASDARHIVVAGPFKNLGPDRADIWIGQFDAGFESIAKWVQVTNNDYMDVYASVWVDPGLGQYAGEAPYTLEVQTVFTGDGALQWTYGDGSAGTTGTHTYTTPGSYLLTARQGNRILKGTVRVAERIAPELVSASTLDDRRVLITFSEPVRIENAKVTTDNGTSAVRLGLDSEERSIIAEFAEPLSSRETLTVSGVTDRAQVPSQMAIASVLVVQPDWPSNRAGLYYLWQNARSRNVILDEQLMLPVTTDLTGGAKARFNRYGAAVANGGMFNPSPGSAERITAGIRKTKQFSCELVFASDDLTQSRGDSDKPIAIVAWGYGWRNGIFWLFQEKQTLSVGLSKSWGDHQPEVFEMATLPDTRPHHVIISWAENRLAFYLDGKKVKEIDPSPAHIITLTPPLGFAAHHPEPAKNVWCGTFEYLAMYNRFIEEPEAAKNAAIVAASIANRKELPRIEVQASLINKSKIPNPNEIAPYRNVLIVCEYQVQAVLKGTFHGKTIRVVQWGMLDLKPTPLAAMQPGANVKMVLERFADHDELAPELISDTLEENFDLDLFTDVNL